MLIGFALTVLRGAVMALVAGEIGSQMSKSLKRLYAAVQALLVKFPAAVPAIAVVVTNFLARYGFHVSTTQLALWASAVATVIGVLMHRTLVAASKKSSGK